MTAEVDYDAGFWMLGKNKEADWLQENLSPSGNAVVDFGTFVAFSVLLKRLALISYILPKCGIFAKFVGRILVNMPEWMVLRFPIRKKTLRKHMTLALIRLIASN